MSKLATSLPTVEEIATRVRRGPSGACDIYGDGDLEDWAAVTRLKAQACWTDVHKAVDATLDIAKPIGADKFRYHWSRKCWHWTEEQKRVQLEDVS